MGTTLRLPLHHDRRSAGASPFVFSNCEASSCPRHIPTLSPFPPTSSPFGSPSSIVVDDSGTLQQRLWRNLLASRLDPQRRLWRQPWRAAMTEARYGKPREAVKSGCVCFVGDVWSANMFIKPTRQAYTALRGSNRLVGNENKGIRLKTVQEPRFFAQDGIEFTILGFINEPDLDSLEREHDMGRYQAFASYRWKQLYRTDPTSTSSLTTLPDRSKHGSNSRI